jgi:hypothetical protein
MRRAFFSSVPAVLLALVIGGGSTVLAQSRIEFTWPTPNPAWSEGKSYEAWVQPTVSGEPESGLFGCIRSHGTQFHEGLDIRPLKRDARGEPADVVTAAMDGVVRHVNMRPGYSSYGRYIVVEHPSQTPVVYTLYAHLARVEPGIRPGAAVRRGQAIALMGRSAGGYAIPRERAHLHFEIGLYAADDFQAWYAWKRFGSPNEHGKWNGMNLLGIDPNDFLREWRRRSVDTFQEYFDRMRPVVRLRVATTRVPDFIRRYPSLLRKPMPVGLVGGWEVECNGTGLPYAWTPLSSVDVAGMRPGTVRIVSADAALLRAWRCKALVRGRSGNYTPGSDLATMLQLIFGLR